MPARTIKKEETLEGVLSAIPCIFDQAQLNSNNHQKNIVALHKIHAAAAEHIEPPFNGKGPKLVGERAFNDAFLCMVLRILDLKKGTANADRIVKFVGAYVKYANEKALEARNEDLDPEEAEDSFASRCTARLLSSLLPGFVAKDKNVRYRVLQLNAEMVSHLGEIDADIYAKLQKALRARVTDKEAMVRVQAIIALSKMIGSEDPSELEDDEPPAKDILIEALYYDSAADVRRAATLNLPVAQETLPHILSRLRDEDSTNRKIVLKVLKDHVTQEDDESDEPIRGVTHPRVLTVAQREEIVRSGLGDRDASVRDATGDLLATWVDCLSGYCDSAAQGADAHFKDEGNDDIKPENGSEKNNQKQPLDYQEGLLTLLALFDLGLDTVAEDALLSVFATRMDIFESLEFDDDFWKALTAERAFLVRVYIEYCSSKKNQAKLEAALPVAMEFAYRIQTEYNNLVAALAAEKEAAGIVLEDEDERNKREDELLDNIFVIGEMLKLAVHFDYADEIGRRSMFQIIRIMLSQVQLPETLVCPSLDVFRELATGERDLIRLIVEITQDLRHPPSSDDEEEPSMNSDLDEQDIGATPATVKPARMALFNKPTAREDMSAEERARVDAVDLRCLSLLTAVLERVNGTLEENTVLDGVLGELIFPSSNRKEPEFHEQGLVAMGLCSLIHRPMAPQCMTRCMKEMVSKTNPSSLKLRLVHVFFDLLMVNERDFLGKNAETAKMLTDFALTLFKDEEDTEVQAAIGLGLTKLVLAGMLPDDTVLRNLVWVYFQPATGDNQELTQCLACFLSAYSSSSPHHQRSINQLFLPIMCEFLDLRKKDEGQDMVSPMQVATIFADWTNPLKLKLKVIRPQDEEGHVDMAINIIREVLIDKDNLYDKDIKKALCQLLSKLYIPDVVEDVKLRELKILLHGCRTRRPLRETTSRNALAKFDTAISKKFEKQLDGFDEEEYRKFEELQSLFDFLDDIFPENDGEDIDLDGPRKRRKRRSDSIISASTEDENTSMASSTKNDKSKSKVKRPRLSRTDDESDEETITPPPPRRSRPQRAAAAKPKPPQVITISSDSDEDEQPTPVSRNRRRPRMPSHEVKFEGNLNDELDQILEADTSAEIPHDSIMDDSEEEEDEVNDLILGGD